MGQAKKNRRDCPALGRLITALECGENRGTRLACPPDCPHFPFAAHRYHDARAIVARASEVQAERFRRTPLGREIIEPMFQGDPSLKASHRYYQAMARERDPQSGRTFLEEWQADRFDGLKNDERVVIASLLGLTFVLLQIEHIVDDETFLARDLLAGEESAVLEFRDRGVCASVGQFTVFLCAIHAFPHYGRVWGVQLLLPTVPGITPLALLQRTAAHLGCAGTEPAALRTWAETHLLRLAEAFEAIVVAVRKRFIEALGGQAVQRWYRLLAPAGELQARLAQEEVFEPVQLNPGDAAAGLGQRFLWVADSGSDLPKLGAEVRGTVAFAAREVVLEATSSAHAEALRVRFEACAGERVRFEREQRQDHTTALRGVEIYDESLIPPDLLEQQGAVAVGQFSVSASEIGEEGNLPQRLALAWLDERIPMFQNRTPREAALEPGLLPLVRQQLRAMVAAEDLSRVHGRPFLDYNPVIEALGQEDLRHHLPKGWVPPRHGSEDDDGGPDILGWPERLQHISPLEVAAEPLTHESLEAIAGSSSAQDYTEEDIREGYADAIDLLFRNAPHELSEDEGIHLLQTFFDCARLICAPTAPRFGFDTHRFEDRADCLLDAIEETILMPSQLRAEMSEIIQRLSRQPVLGLSAAALILQSHSNGPVARRTRPEMVGEMISLVVAALDELDACVTAWRHLHGGVA